MQIPKPTSSAQAAGFIFCTVVLANILATWVLGANLEAMVYPHDADAIMIPIVNNFLNSLFVLVLAATGALLPRHRLAWRLASRVLVAMAGLYALLLVVYWWYPQHYLIGASFIPVVAACAWALWLPATKIKAPSVTTASIKWSNFE